MKFYSPVLIVGISTSIFALEYSGSIYSRYGENLQPENEFTYTENFISLNIQGDSWDITSEFAYNKPPEYGLKFSGIRTLSFNLIQESWSLYSGHLTAVFGNGLAFNFFEDKSLDFDNRPFGLRVDFDLSEEIQITSLYGRRNEFTSYSPSADRTPDILTSYDAGGAQLSYFPEDQDWNSSGYFTLSKFRSPVRMESLNLETLSSTIVDTNEQEATIIGSGITFTYFSDNWEWNIEYGALKKWFDLPLVKQEFDGTVLKTVESTSNQTGTVLYSQWIGSLPDYSTLTIEYKLYQNGIESSDDKINFNRLASKSFPFNLGPTSLPQHVVGLLANLTHVVDYGDEVGFNIDYRKNLGESFLLTGIYSQASRTSISEQKNTQFMPKMDIEYFPFQEWYIELEYSGITFQNRAFAAFTDYSTDGISKEQYISFIPFYFSQQMGSYVFSGLFGTQNVSKSGKNYKNQQVILSVDWKQKLSFSLVADQTSDPSFEENARWVSGEISYKPSSALTLRTNYGTEKGGVRCTGGVCRYISPFDGMRLMLEVRL